LTITLPKHSDLKAGSCCDDLIPGFLPSGIILLYGSEKSGKSFFATQLAYAISSGESFLEFSNGVPRKVLYFGLDDKDSSLFDRFNQFNEEYCVVYNYRLFTEHLLKIQGNAYRNCPLITMDSFVNLIKVIIHDTEFRPDLIIIDTFTKIRDYRREHDYDSEVNEIQKLRSLTTQGISVLLVSHKRKTADTYIGSAGTGAEPDALINFTSETNEVKKINIVSNAMAPVELAFKVNYETGVLQRIQSFTEETIDKDLISVITYLFAQPKKQFAGTMQELAFLPRNGTGNRTAESLGKLIRKMNDYLASENIAVVMNIRVGKKKILTMKAYDYTPSADEVRLDSQIMIEEYKAKDR